MAAALRGPLAVIVGLLAGVVAAVYRGRWPEWVANVFTLVGLSVPSFWLGILAILYLAVGLGWFPASGYVPVSEEPLRGLYYLALPAVRARHRAGGGGDAADPGVDDRVALAPTTCGRPARRACRGRRC